MQCRRQSSRARLCGSWTKAGPSKQSSLISLSGLLTQTAGANQHLSPHPAHSPERVTSPCTVRIKTGWWDRMEKKTRKMKNQRLNNIKSGLIVYSKNYIIYAEAKLSEVSACHTTSSCFHDNNNMAIFYLFSALRWLLLCELVCHLLSNGSIISYDVCKVINI